MKKECIILVDIGNTSVSAGIGSGDRVLRMDRMSSYGPIRSAKRLIGKTVDGIEPSGCVIASVVPALTGRWKKVVRAITRLDPMIVHHKLKMGVSIDYPNPGTIGADRLANATGAVARYGCPVIVADFGTALTFDVVSARGAYMGGVIAPGLPLMTDYLFEKTALLPRISLKGRHGGIGRTTEQAMRIGAKFGYRGIVREIVEYLFKELGTRKVALCATGGFSGWAVKGLEMGFHCDRDLTLFGMKKIYDLNRVGKRGNRDREVK